MTSIQETTNKIFDVAKWSTDDIEATLNNLDIEIPKNDDFHEFIADTIEYLSNNFDAEIGINWNVIENAVYIVAQRNGHL